MQEIVFEGHIPSVNHIYSRSKYGTYLNDQGKKFKTILGWTARKQKVKKLTGNVKLYFEWHCIKKGQGDLDNKCKVIQDGLNGIAYIDDKQIIELHAKKIQFSTFDGVLIRIEELKDANEKRSTTKKQTKKR